jgi:hypothetical protein
MLQPRVAVVLNVPRKWHPFLFICRLLPTLPALWCGARYVLRFLVADLLRYYDSHQDDGEGAAAGHSKWTMSTVDLTASSTRLRYIAMGLSIIWVCLTTQHLPRI